MATPMNEPPEFSDTQMAWLRSHPAFQLTPDTVPLLEETRRQQPATQELPLTGKRNNT